MWIAVGSNNPNYSGTEVLSIGLPPNNNLAPGTFNNFSSYSETLLLVQVIIGLTVKSSNDLKAA